MSDLFLFEKVEEPIGYNSSQLNILEFVKFINKVVGTDFFVSSQIGDIQIKLCAFGACIPEKIRKEARAIFVQKNRERGGLWRQAGLVGSLIEIHGKLSRLENDSQDKDSWVDLYNYIIIALMSIQLNLIRIADEKKRVVVTGDQQGLGRAIASTFVLNGFEVIPYGIRKTSVEIKEFFNSYPYDSLDLLVNNYGINHLNWIGSIEEQDYEVLDANIKLPSMVVNELVAARIGPTRILNILSQTYRIPQRCTSIYCASKAAMAQMTKVMARELASDGYVVNGLAPGKILGTRMTELTDAQVLALRGWEEEKADEYALSSIPMKRFTTPEEVALAVIKIIHLPPYVNGSIIDMMGGV